MLGLDDPIARIARTIRRWLFALPGRLTRTASRSPFTCPRAGPGSSKFIEALRRIRALPAAA